MSSPYPSGPPRSYPADPQPAPRPQGLEPPGIALTVVITFLFGLWGLIPAAMGANRATELRRPSGRYWSAFGLTMLFNVLLVVGAVMAFILFTGGSLAALAGLASQQGTTKPAEATPAATPETEMAPAPRQTPAAPPTYVPPQQAEPAGFPAYASVCTATSGPAGGFSQSASANSVTSCPFAESVREAYGNQSVRSSTVSVYAYSSVTGRTYLMTCSGSAMVTCRGGNDAVVYLR